ncbi:MAG TPA: FkbM family methyltransferase [Beijerinckiaceae bacterium]|jgi:FkbM family methyltransferase
MMSLEARRAAHRRRGLAAYPDDLPGDAERIEGITAVVERLAGPVRLRLPAFDLVVEVPPEVGAKILYLLAVDDYETSDLELLTRHVGSGDRLMVLGGGIGVTTALGTRITGEPVTVIEANLALHPVIAQQAVLNGGRVTLVHAAVVGDAAAYPDGSVTFEVASDFWYSRLGAGHGAIAVPALGFDRLCAEHRPSAVLIDIEGAETDVLAGPVPETVRTLIVEIHTPELGAAATGAIVTRLVGQGFTVVDQQALSWTFLR